MRAVLDYCTDGIQRDVPAGTIVIHEGGTTGHLFVLIAGRLEVIKGDTIVASITEPGAMVGEMSVLLDQPHNGGLSFLPALRTPSNSGLLDVTWYTRESVTTANTNVAPARPRQPSATGRAVGMRVTTGRRPSVTAPIAAL